MVLIRGNSTIILINSGRVIFLVHNALRHSTWVILAMPHGAWVISSNRSPLALVGPLRRIYEWRLLTLAFNLIHRLSALLDDSLAAVARVQLSLWKILCIAKVLLVPCLLRYLFLFNLESSFGWLLRSWDSAKVSGRRDSTLIDVAQLMVLSVHSNEWFTVGSHLGTWPETTRRWHLRPLKRFCLLLLYSAHLMNQVLMLALQIWIGILLLSLGLLELLALDIESVIIISGVREVLTYDAAVVILVLDMWIDHINALVLTEVTRTCARIGTHACLHSKFKFYFPFL